MGRRRGRFAAFVYRNPTDRESALIHDCGIKGSPERVYWTGAMSARDQAFSVWRTNAREFNWSHEADEAALMLAVQFPEWMGKLMSDFEFIPESDFERKERMRLRRKALREARASIEKKQG